MAFGWEGQLVRLVPIDVERHLENYYQWLNDPEITENLLVGDTPITRHWEENFLKSVGSSDTNILFAIEILNGEHIGGSGVHQIERQHGTAITGTFIGKKELWGKGYGTDAAVVRTKYCFDVLGLRLLMSGILEGNERSAKMLENAGYHKCGVIPQRYWKRGRYRDEIMYAITRS